MLRLSRTFPPGLAYQVAFDTTEAVEESVKEVLITLAIAIILVVLVIYLFLQDWRSTLIPSITIPVSLIGTFAFIKFFGFSINSLTLWLNRDSRELSKKGLQQSTQQGFSSLFSIIDKLEEAQVQG
jgi:Cu/Ag efflux pump CusA